MISFWIAVVLAQAVPAPSIPASVGVTGRVVNSLNGDAVAKAVVILRAHDPEHSLSNADETDAQGHFSIPDIEPGEYAIAVERAGFVLESTGAAGAPGRTIEIDAGQPRNDLTLLVSPLGVIAGRVIDAEGEPARGARVNALHYVYVRGRKPLPWPRLATAATFASSDCALGPTT